MRLAFAYAALCLTLLPWFAQGQTSPASPPQVQTVPASVAQGQTAPVPAASGRIQFQELVADLGKIRAGDIATHTFYFTNSGNAVLTLTHVQPSCGCTAASDWTRTVEPGNTGTIPVSFNSGTFSGQINKSIEVGSSDVSQPRVTLQIKADVWRPVDVTPQFAVINIPPDSTSGSVTVRIVNNTSDKLKFEKPETDSPAFEAKILPGTNSNEHLMQISTKGRLPAGNVQTKVTVKTSSTNAPTITVTAWANVQPHYVVIPGQMTLPAPPLTGPISPSVLVQNNSSKPMAITNAAVNIPGTKVEVREMIPGRQFSIYATFPQGFEIPQGQQVFLTAQPGAPEMPDIRVPIAQMPRPSAPAHATLPSGMTGQRGVVTQPRSLPAAPGS